VIVDYGPSSAPPVAFTSERVSEGSPPHHEIIRDLLHTHRLYEVKAGDGLESPCLSLYTVIVRGGGIWGLGQVLALASL